MKLKFALINGEKCEPTKGARGLCPLCGSELIARCGDVNVHHWAHKGKLVCDRWWENETDWHRSWKGKFPKGWQEVVHYDKSGEKHIADVKTESGWVLEFQHSYLNPEERRSRNEFYSKLVWVVNGARRKTDESQFQRIFDEGTAVIIAPLIKRVHFPDECRLLKEWNGDNSLVFFDFSKANSPEQSHLWFLFPKISSGEAYLSPFPRVNLIDSHNTSKFEEVVQKIFSLLQNELARRKQIQHRNELYSRPDIRLEIHRRLARENRNNWKKRL